VCQILEMLRQTAVQSVYTVDSSMADTVVNGFFEYRPIRIAKIIDESGEQAMTRIDMRLADKVKEDIRAYNKLLADELASLIGDYEYDKILNLLAEAKQIREQMMDEQ
ncbi:MAG: hypothetical protein GY749_47175, partial [Desulfobacteraceae bacterium]|nr:hypothetical protein [Desulfobacteraceae bacterium]